MAADVEWSQQGNYHTADFIQNGFDTKVWMNINAQWVMTNTDLQTADQLPPGAYNAFTFSSFSQWTVQNVFFIEFPKRPAVYVVQVNMDNSDAIYQLFPRRTHAANKGMQAIIILPSPLPSLILCRKR